MGGGTGRGVEDRVGGKRGREREIRRSIRVTKEE